MAPKAAVVVSQPVRLLVELAVLGSGAALKLTVLDEAGYAALAWQRT